LAFRDDVIALRGGHLSPKSALEEQGHTGTPSKAVAPSPPCGPSPLRTSAMSHQEGRPGPRLRKVLRRIPATDSEVIRPPVPSV